MKEGTLNTIGEVHKGMRVSLESSTINQIHHIQIKSKHFNNIMDVRNRRGANIDSDHYMVRTKIRERIFNANKTKAIRENRYNLHDLKSPVIAQKYEDSRKHQDSKYSLTAHHNGSMINTQISQNKKTKLIQAKPDRQNRNTGSSKKKERKSTRERKRNI